MRVQPAETPAARRRAPGTRDTVRRPDAPRPPGSRLRRTARAVVRAPPCDGTLPADRLRIRLRFVGGSCRRTAPRGARRKALVTGVASAPRGAVRRHPRGYAPANGISTDMTLLSERVATVIVPCR